MTILVRAAALAAFLVLGSAASFADGVDRPRGDDLRPPSLSERELDDAYDLLARILREMNRQGGIARVGANSVDPESKSKPKIPGFKE